MSLEARTSNRFDRSDQQPPMKLLHVITSINRGGAENHLYDLVRTQIKSGLAVSVAYLKGDGYWTQALNDAGARVLPLGLMRYGTLGPVWRLRRLILQTKPDIVHVHMPPAELYTALALTGLDAPPVVVSKHNDEPFYHGPGSIMLARLTARRAAHVVAISDAVNRYVRQVLSGDCPSITTVRYGIDTTPFASCSIDARDAVRRQLGLRPETLAIGTVARLVPQKALPVLLHAYERFRRRTTTDSRLVMVGRGPLEANLRALAEKLGIAGEIIWAGFREDIPAVMASFDVFALTSSYEGFGLVLLEAMAARRPVVATAVSAIPEIVVDGQTGFLCPAGDIDAVAGAFERLLERDLRLRLGEKGFERAVSEFTLERMVSAVNAIYRDCMA